MAQNEALRYCEESLLGSVSVDTFAERKRLQKSIYLLQEFGIDLGYQFRWYLYGPYSDELADDAYRVSILPSNGQEPHNADKIEALRQFLGDDIESPDSLELLASLHFLFNKAYFPNKTRETVIQYLLARKPYFNRDQVDHALERLMQIGLVRV